MGRVDQVEHHRSIWRYLNARVYTSQVKLNDCGW